MLIASFGPLLFFYDWHFFACAPHARELVFKTFGCVVLSIKSLDCLEFLSLAELLMWMHAPVWTHMARGSKCLGQTSR